MGSKRFVSNPVGGGVVENTVFQIPPEITAKIKALEANLLAAQNKPPKTVEVEKIVEVFRDNPIHLQKIKKLELELQDLKNRGAYKLVKQQVGLLSPNVEQKAVEMPEVDEKTARSFRWQIVGIAFTVGIFLGALAKWLITLAVK